MPAINLVLVIIILGCFIQCSNSETKDCSIATTHEPPFAVAEKVSEGQPVLDSIRALVIGNFTRPLWSPGGSNILLTKEGNTGLFYADINYPEMIVELNDIKGVGYGAAWSFDGKEVFFSEKENFKPVTKSISLETKKVLTHPDIHFSAIHSYTQTNGEGPLLQLNPETLQVEATDPATGKSWKVTTESGQYYEPLLSPDRTKVAAHRGAELLVFHTDGSGIYKSLGRGIASGWSPDSKYLLVFVDESADGHQVTNSDLYLVSADGSIRYPLTSTADVHEVWPSWNPVKNEIAFADAKSGNIFIAELHLNK